MSRLASLDRKTRRVHGVLTVCFWHSGSDAPFCSTLILYSQESTSSGTYSFHSYNCQTGSGTRVTGYQTTHDPSTTSSSATSSTSSQDGSSSDASTPSSRTSGATRSATNLPTTSPGTRTTASAAAQNVSGGLSQGAQIGIGVGVGLAVAGALIAASLWLWHPRGTRNTAHSDTSHAHYGDTGDQSISHSGLGHLGMHRYSDDALRKQDREHLAPAELTSTPVHHELDGTRRR
jgi:hypothetical protein